MFAETNERLDYHIESSDKKFDQIHTELGQIHEELEGIHTEIDGIHTEMETMHRDFDQLHEEEHETGRKVETLRSGLTKAAHAAR
jgi:uncharacterized coiled-coil DUF342 family protein